MEQRFSNHCQPGTSGHLLWAAWGWGWELASLCRVSAGEQSQAGNKEEAAVPGHSTHWSMVHKHTDPDSEESFA